MIVLVGLSHKTAPIEVRERLAVPADAIAETLRRLSQCPSIGETMCLSTCNRVEIVAVPKPQIPLDDVVADVVTTIEMLCGGDESVRASLYRHKGEEAVRHLFRVAASLDSIVIGEPQILGQVKDAFEAAQSAGTVGPVLHRVLSKALHAAKRVRSETAIGEGLVSVSSVAVDLAHQIFGNLHGRRVLLIGAGEMAEAAAMLLAKEGATVTVVNRNPERAAELARRFGASARSWDDLSQALTEADVVLSSTSSRAFVLTHELVHRAMKTRKGRTLFLIDIAVPRDVDPAVNTIDGVFAYDVDDLEGIVVESQKGRAEEALKADRILEAEAKAIDAWVETRGVTPTIVALRAKVRATLMAELERSTQGKLRHLGETERAALEAMLDGAVNKLLHAPTTHLKKAASEPRGEQMAKVIRELFELPDVGVVSDTVSEVRASQGKKP